MPNINDNTQIVQSLVELIKEEHRRIVTSKLTSTAGLERFITTASEAIVKDTIENNENFIKDLASLHRKLADVKLPGDFEALEEEFKPAKTEDKPIAVESIKTAAIIQEALDTKEEEVITVLEKIAYTLGSKGQHEAAYKIERTAREIEELIK